VPAVNTKKISTSIIESCIGQTKSEDHQTILSKQIKVEVEVEVEVEAEAEVEVEVDVEVEAEVEVEVETRR